MSHDPHPRPEPDAVPGWPPGAIALIQFYTPLLIDRALAAVGDYDEACDLAQETLVRFLDKDRYPPLKLYTILKNLIRDRARRRRRYLAPGMESDRVIESVPDREPDALTRTEVNERCRRVLKAIEQLPPDRAEILLRHIWSGVPTKEIANDLNIKDGAVRTRLTRAVQEVRAIAEDS